MKWIFFTVVVIGMVVLGCRQDRQESVSDTGTVVHVALEGGFFGIVDDHGGRWDPSNLSEEFRSDSLRVRFEGIVTDLPTFHMWGRTIKLTSIRRLQ